MELIKKIHTLLKKSLIIQFINYKTNQESFKKMLCD